ncbi:rab GTPase-binding effector protein 1-like isoform X1 [Haliotis rufescens]|uniref:rab GTPase-binding effector protein 1-like isoform X1 n=1 Tax=Haliotis rufescens TaxID=6454 RepID=UPI001EB07E56|nr:rab GTPase-binding effector protein 1-like isoform X1 [Haliotis rufescens]
MTDNIEFGPLESADLSPTDELATLKQRLADLEEREQTLAREKLEAESEFGIKRAKFKELFLQKEDELKKEKETRAEWQDKISQLEEELGRVRAELEGVKTAAAVTETSRCEELTEIRRLHQQEVDSLQHIMSEAADEASNSTAAQYECERTKLSNLTVKYEEEIQSLRSKLSQEREGFLANVAKSLKRVGGIGPNLTPEQENLEDSMRKAQEDAEMLKSVVMPLEEEISMLKEKLKLAEQKISVNECLLGDEAKKSPSLPDLDDLKDPDEKIAKLMKYLKGEKAARTDLEMYVAVLTTQKNVLCEDMDRVQKEMNEVCSLLEDEKQNHEALKQTWQMANDQFLESQRLMMMDMRRMETVLTSEQQRQIAELQQKDLEREAQEKKVKDLEEAREKQEKELAERRKHSVSRMEQAAASAALSEDETKEKLKRRPNVLDKSQSRSNASLISNTSEELIPFDVSADDEIRKSLSSPDINFDDKFLDSGVHDSLSEVDGMTIRISPDKVLNLPSLTEAQMKSITDPTPDSEARRILLASAKMKTEGLSLEGKRLVSEKEWKLIQDEVKSAREKLGRPCDMCTNYETQLQTVQEELKAATTEAARLDRQLNSEKQALTNITKYQTELEEALKESSEEAEKQISSLNNKLQDCEKYLKECKQQFIQSQLQLQDQLKSLTESREEIQKEIKLIQEENDSLVGKHSKTAQQLQNEDINLPNNMEEMQLLLLKYREEIIAAKVAKEHTEETLRSEIMFLKDQVVSEQQEKNTIEETLSQELSTLQEKLVCHESVQSELERESSVRAESETKLRETEQSLKSVQAKSRQLINALQQRVEEHERSKVKLEDDLHSLKGKVQSLQVDLDNSEAVQRDFVKLSQSLQIQLEKIRQAENEVRWQHEEDVEDCNNCKQNFSVTRRKHHCRHCGKIFCNECTSKTVHSGPNFKPSKVCDVCHTILVKDATPYFSTEPPATPD